ncbi:hypothetical protein [Alicyclobacillus sp. ALC3]|nr:hypothetical protein [Alicyclobacillus sp. ALC3]WDL96930.1 hypothetical protein JC200_22070 [Alicyclobacillus sp. ALC3]
MKAADVQAQIDKLQQEVVGLKSELHDRQEAIKHLEAVRDAMSEEEK